MILYEYVFQIQNNLTAEWEGVGMSFLPSRLIWYPEKNIRYTILTSEIDEGHLR